MYKNIIDFLKLAKRVPHTHNYIHGHIGKRGVYESDYAWTVLFVYEVKIIAR